MANIYVRSTDGNNADNGSTWALAKATLAGAAAIDAAGDTIFVSQSHNESTAASVSLTWSGGLSQPTNIICVNDGAEPPTAVAATAQIATTGANSLTVAAGSSNTYYYGITFMAGSGAVAANVTLAVSGALQRFENCNFKIVSTGAGCRIATIGRVEFENCGFQFAAAAQGFSITGTKVIIRGGSIIAGGVSPINFLDMLNGGGSEVLVEGFDMSNFDAGVVLVENSQFTFHYSIRFINCKLPASWSGSPNSGTIPAESVIELINCSAGSENYSYWKRASGGDVRHETTVVRTGGASDGTTPLSWKMTANAVIAYHTIVSPDIYIWNETVGSSLIATIEIVNDGSTLNDDEIWIELMYLGSSGQPLATHIRDIKATFLTTAAAQSSSSVTWTTTGLGSPVKQKVSVTFTPQMVGFIIARVVLAKASATVYVDPVITIS